MANIVILITILAAFIVNHCSSILIQNQYDKLLEIRTEFHLETIYPEPIDFCSNAMYILCTRGNTTVLNMSLTGDGNTVIPSFDVFVDLEQLSISHASDTNHFLYNYNTFLPASINTVSCEYCGITKIPFEIKLSSLSLRNNPIGSGEFNITQQSNLDLTNPDPLFQDYIIKIHQVQDCQSLGKLTRLSLMINEPLVYPCFTSLYSLTIQLGSFYGTGTNITNIPLTTFPGASIQILAYIGYPGIIYEPPKIISYSIEFINIRLSPQPNVIPINRVLNGFNCLNSVVTTTDGRFLYETSTTIDISISNCGITNIYPEMFTGARNVDLTNNGLVAPFPYYLLGKDFLYMDKNKFYGEIDRRFCDFKSSFAYNNLSGVLPSCFACYLNYEIIRRSLIGNQFSNYNNGNIYPLCDTISIDSFSNFSLTGSSKIIGYDLPMIRDMITSNIPNITFTSVADSINLTYRPQNLPDILKYKDFILTIKATRDFVFTLPVSKSSPVILSHSPASPYLNLGYSFVFIASPGAPIANYKILIDNSLVCETTEVQDKQHITIIKCIVSTYNIPEKVLRFSFETPSAPIFYWDVPFIRRFPIISAVSGTPKLGGSVTMYGTFGENLSNADKNDFSVSIGPLACDIKTLDSSTIICVLPSSSLSGIQNITIVSYGVPSLFLNLFSFYEDVNYCGDGCNGHGFCSVSGGLSQCYCDIGWGGSLCAYKVYYGSAKNNGSTTEISQDQVKFGLTIVGVQEISYDGSILKERLFDKWNQTTTNNETTFSYSHLYENSTVSYQIEEILKQKTIEFAGYIMSMDPGTFKLTANVSNWQFVSSISSLKLLINTSMIVGDGCTDTEINSFGGETSLTHITIEKDGKIFYGRFIDRILSDGKPTFSSTKIINQTTTSILLGISLPHCSQCMLDPDFSILISNKQDNNCGETSSNRSWVIPTAVVVSIVGAAVLGTIAALIISRFYYIKFSKKQLLIIKKEKKKSGTDGEIKMR